MQPCPRIIALVPAYNEEVQIAQSIESLLQQTHTIDQILVIPNNCTDATADIARHYAEMYPTIKIMEIRECKGKKAGALNQALATLDPDNWDFVLQMDADTELDPRLVEEGLLEFQRNPKLGGVSSRCFLKPYTEGASLTEKILWSFQNLEYGFGDSRNIQNNGRVKVLAGAVCIYRMDVLWNVRRSCSRESRDGLVWSENSLVEDYELTLDTQKLGYETEAGMRMFSWTDAMFSIGELKNQRFRWYGGTVTTLKRRKLSRETRLEALVQLYYVLVIICRLLLILFLTLMVVDSSITQIQPQWWWPLILGLIMINYLRRLMFVRNRNFSQWIIVLTLLPLELYVTWDQLLTLTAYGRNLVSPSRDW